MAEGQEFAVGDSVVAIGHAQFNWGLSVEPGDVFALTRQSDVVYLNDLGVGKYFKLKEES